MERPSFEQISTKLDLPGLIRHLNTVVFPTVVGAVSALVSAFNAQSSNSKTITAAYTATVEDGLIRADATAGAITITLPTSAKAGRKRYTVKKVDGGANAVTIDGNGAELIDGALTKVLGAWGVATIQANDMGWDVL